MTSEIRANTIKNRVGLGTVSFTNTGPVVSGIVTANGLELNSVDTGSSADPEIKLYRNSASPADADYLGQVKFAGESDTGVERNYAKITGKILDASNGTEDGILEFAHIKGGSQTITGRWRSDSLQLLNDTNLSVAGDTTLTSDLDVDGHTNLDNVSIAGVTTVANTLRYNDNVYASFGTDGDASLWHDNSHLRFNNGTGNFNIQSNDFQITDSSNTTLRFRVDADGPTYVRYNGLDRLITSNAGVSFPRDIDVDGHTNLDNVSIAGVTTMTGNLTINSTSNARAIILPDNKRIYFGDGEDFWIGSNGTNGEVSGSLWFYNHLYLYDNVRLRIGHGQDLELFHNGTDSYIDNNTGNLHLDSASNIIFETGSSTERLRITSSGALGTNSTVRSANGGLDLCSQGATNYGTLTLGAGGGQNGQSRSSNQENQFRIMMPTYADPSLMTTVLYGTSGSAGHDLFYGGGTGWAYATNTHRFFTTPGQTTGNGTERIRIKSDGKVQIRSGTVIQFTNTNNDIITDTSDGSDNKRIVISGGGATDSSRGANINLTGNEYSGANGKLELTAGNSGNANGSIDCYTGGSLRLQVKSDGNLVHSSTTAFQIAKGTTAQRPSAATGMVRYNTSTSKLEYYDGSAWQSLKTTFDGLGGNSTYTFGGYKIHVFTSNGNFTVTGAGSVDALIVAGGGGAGASDRNNYNGAWSGGGGGGGVLWQQSISVASGTTYSIVVGNGGAVQNNGQNSTAFGYTAIGGGRGGGTTSAGSGNVNWNGASGGSGGGGLGDRVGPMQGGSGTSGQGNSGANGTDPGGNPYYEQGGGGGGAGEAGNTDGIGFGGDGRDMSGEFGTSVGENGYFGGGGAGGQGTDNSASVNSGGLGGGGDSGGGYQNNSYASQAGQANTGGGGGAGGNASGSGQGGQAGGSGVVLVRYAL